MRHLVRPAMRLREYTSAPTSSSRVDRDAGVIRDVLILGHVSANQRVYTHDALAAAARLYEGVRVFADHQPDGRRSVRDLVGWLSGVRLAEGGLRGDLHLLAPDTEFGRVVLGAAERHPSSLGLSHDAEGRTVTHDGQTIVEAIESVRSVDLVAEPATTRSLYEDRAMPDVTTPPTADAKAAAPDPLEALYQSLTLDDLAAKRPDLLDALKKQIQQEIATPMGDLKTQLQALQAKLDEYMAAEQADQQMAEAKLDPARVPPRLREAIRHERNATRRAALIEEVRRLTQTGPIAASGWPAAPAPDLTTRLADWRI
jgi:Skp family chaperone for outer membrane proteins